MQSKLLYTLSLCILFSVNSYAFDQFVCPAPSEPDKIAETAEDCPWAGAARVLGQAADEGQDIGPLFQTLVPDLAQSLKKDSNEVAARALWGHSINYDELANGIIVHNAILNELARELRVAPPEGKIVHAGMEHTYGYLFSLLPTNFGFKRARWVQNDIVKGFGLLPHDILGPTPSQGTLLSNVTYFIGKIALSDDPNASSLIAASKRSVADVLVRFPYQSLKPVRLEETLDLRGAHREARKVVLRTDLIPFFNQPSASGANTHLLVYSVYDSKLKGAQLITAFPVASSFVDTVVNPANLGPRKSIITRYNAYVEGVTDSSSHLVGLRRVVRK